MEKIPAGLRPCLADLRRALEEALGPDLAGLYAGGSVALGDFTPGRSDLDLAAVVSGPLDDAAREAVIERVSALGRWCGARGVELVVYTEDQVRAPARRPLFELNLNAGPGTAFRATRRIEDEPAHWFLIDLAILRAHGVPLLGPPPDEVVGEIPRSRLLDALSDSAGWHAAHEPGSENARLNAIRGRVFASEGRWVSKTEAAAREREGPE